MGLVCWHIQGLERNARWKAHAQAQQAWTLIEGLEGPAWVTSRDLGLLMGGERAGQAAIQDRAVWPEIFSICSADGQGSNDEGRHKTTNKGSLNSGQGGMG